MRALFLLLPSFDSINLRSKNVTYAHYDKRLIIENICEKQTKREKKRDHLKWIAFRSSSDKHPWHSDKRAAITIATRTHQTQVLFYDKKVFNCFGSLYRVFILICNFNIFGF